MQTMKTDWLYCRVDILLLCLYTAMVVVNVTSGLVDQFEW
jgi:hypothetical protein